MLLNLNKSKSNLKKKDNIINHRSIPKEDSDNNSIDFNERNEDEDPNTPTNLITSW